MKALKALDFFDIESSQTLCVSIYLPQRQARSEEKWRIQAKNSLKKATQLIAADHGKAKAQELIGSPEEVIEELTQARDDRGLAVFISEGFRGYVPFPWKGKELVVVSEKFHVKPLLRWMQDPRKFFLATMSFHQIKLFIGSESELCLLETATLDEVAKRNPKESRGRNDRQSVSLLDSQSLRFDLFSKRLKESRGLLMNHLNGESAPLVLAGPKHMRDLFTSQSMYPYILPDGIDGLYDGFSAKKLHAKALPVVNEFLELEHGKITDVFKKSLSIGSLPSIGKASIEGRVERLLIAEDLHIWGQLNRSNGSIEKNFDQRDSKDNDILDEISEQVLRCKGEVFVLSKDKMPGEEPAYAILRW